MTRVADPVLDRLAALDPARPALAALRAVPPAPEASSDVPGPPARERPRARRRLVPIGVGVGALALAAAAGLPLLSGSPGGTASAADALTRVAHVAGRWPTSLPRTDQFLYVRSTESGYVLPALVGSEDRPLRVAATRETWTSAERPGRMLSTPRRGDAGVPSPADGRPGSVAATHGLVRIGSLRLSPAAVAAFPTDPRAIYRRLVAGAAGRGPSPEAQAFDDAASALAEQALPAGLRAGLYRALTLVPRLRLVGPVRDARGRPGTAVALAVAGTRRELVFDATSSRLLEQKVTVDSPSAAGVRLPAGTVISRTTYDRVAVTDAPVRP